MLYGYPLLLTEPRGCYLRIEQMLRCPGVGAVIRLLTPGQPLRA